MTFSSFSTEAGVHKSLDSLTEYVVGGKFCKRASFFGDSTVPSSVALSHKAIRATLIYEAAVKLKGLREVPTSSKRKYDREDAGVEERYERKKARESDFRRPHRR